jgi:hypothetical protein
MLSLNPHKIVNDLKCWRYKGKWIYRIPFGTCLCCGGPAGKYGGYRCRSCLEDNRIPKGLIKIDHKYHRELNLDILWHDCEEFGCDPVHEEE